MGWECLRRSEEGKVGDGYIKMWIELRIYFNISYSHDFD